MGRITDPKVSTPFVKELIILFSLALGGFRFNLMMGKDTPQRGLSTCVIVGLLKAIRR